MIDCSSDGGTPSAGSSSSSSGAAPATTASAVIGPQGGTLASSDGHVDITVPPGALPANTTITVAPAATPPAGAVGTVYQFGPDGTKFLVPITLKFHYGDFDLQGHAPSDLRTAAYVNGAWQPWPSTVLDTGAKTVSGQASHFSDQGLVVETGGSCFHVAPTGKQCASTAAADSGSDSAIACSVGPSAPCTSCQVSCQYGQTAKCVPGTVSYPRGGQPVCATPSSCTCEGTPTTPPSGGTDGCTAPTCASSNPCAKYPGSTTSSCTDTVDGPDAQCCYAPGEGACITTSATYACSGGDNQPTTCSTVTCESTPNHCPANTTEKSCTNVSGSSGGGYFTATCCYPPGVDPYAPASGGDGGTSTGGADGGTTGGGFGGGDDAGTSGGGSADASAPPPSDGGTSTKDAGGSTSDAGTIDAGAIDASAPLP